MYIFTKTALRVKVLNNASLQIIHKISGEPLEDQPCYSNNAQSQVNSKVYR